MVTSKRISNFGLPGPGTPRASLRIRRTSRTGSARVDGVSTQRSPVTSSILPPCSDGSEAPRLITASIRSTRRTSPDADRLAAPAPFRDNGNDDTTVAFMQIAQFMQQNITGLVPGRNYLFSLEYNSRRASTDNPLVELTLNGTKVNTFPDPDMFPDGIVLPVGGMGVTGIRPRFPTPRRVRICCSSCRPRPQWAGIRPSCSTMSAWSPWLAVTTSS